MAACIPTPKVNIPVGVSGISLDPTLPELPSVEENICCIMPVAIDLNIFPPLPPLTVNDGLLEPIFEALDQLEDVINQLNINCPRQAVPST